MSAAPLQPRPAGAGMDDASFLRYLLRYCLKALHAEPVAQALGASREDGIAPFAHAVYSVKLVQQAQALQCRSGADEFAQAIGEECPVELPALVAQADHHGHAAPAELAVGFGLDGGDYVLIVGTWRCRLNELRVHGRFSGCDVALLNFAARYLHHGGDGCRQSCQRCHATARNVSCAPLCGAVQ